ncbi:MAG: 50S ribosomal protein L28 [Candidatus Goldiibacteriota bacterium]
MAKKCVICDKQAVSGNNVSHAKNRTKTRFKPNLQQSRIILKGKTVKAWVCTRCLRSNKIVKAA